MNPTKLLTELKKKFPYCWFKDGKQFNIGDAIAVSGSGSQITGMEAFDLNAYQADPQEKVYTAGVHNDLCDFVNKHGCYWEAYNSGIFLLYKM